MPKCIVYRTFHSIISHAAVAAIDDSVVRSFTTSEKETAQEAHGRCTK